MKKFLSISLLMMFIFSITSCDLFKRRVKEDVKQASQYPISDPNEGPGDPGEVDISANIREMINASFEKKMDTKGYEYGLRDSAKYFKISALKLHMNDECENFEEEKSSCKITLAIKKPAKKTARPLFVTKFRQDKECVKGTSVFVKRIVTIASEVLSLPKAFKDLDRSYKAPLAGTKDGEEPGHAGFNDVESLSKFCDSNQKSLLCTLKKAGDIDNGNVKIFTWDKHIVDIVFQKPVLSVCLDDFVDDSQYGKRGTSRNNHMSVAIFKLELISGLWKE